MQFLIIGRCWATNSVSSKVEPLLKGVTNVNREVIRYLDKVASEKIMYINSDLCKYQFAVPSAICPCTHNNTTNISTTIMIIRGKMKP